MSVEPPVPGRKYTYEQVQKMAQAYPGFRMKGYVLRKQDGMYSFVPERQGAGVRGRALEQVYESKESVRELFPVAPIQRRTPQERVNSLEQRLLEEWKKTGHVPGLSEEQVQAIVGKSWKMGNPVSAEHVRALAAASLQDAENRYETSERKKVVRTSPTD